MDISFHCGKCRQIILVDEAAAGMESACPACQHPLRVPSQNDPQDKVPAKPDSGVKPIQQESASRTCPHCGSSDLVKASAAYEQGTSIISGKQSQAGVAVLLAGNVGGIAPGMASGEFSGMQQTVLAQKLSPPVYPKKTNLETLLGPIAIFGALFLGISLVPLSALLFTRVTDRGEWSAFAISFLVLATLGSGAILAGLCLPPKFQREHLRAVEEYKKALNTWQNLWYCTRCGRTAVL